jgi:hypothetical protein
MDEYYRIEVLLWNIGFPGFGQVLNGKLLKVSVLLILEFLITTQSNLNTIIISSFQGEIQKVIEQANYQWLMFYPCVYLFGMERISHVIHSRCRKP